MILRLMAVSVLTIAFLTGSAQAYEEASKARQEVRPKLKKA
jgi:hypothetical protein